MFIMIYNIIFYIRIFILEFIVKNDNIYMIIYYLSAKNLRSLRKYCEIVNIHINNYTYNKVI